jgi:DNA-binding response OmpR family regulator
MNSAATKSSAVDFGRFSHKEFMLLLVGAVEDFSDRNRSIFNQLPCLTERAESCRTALPLIVRGLHHIVISERDLPDGNWKDVLGSATARNDPPVVIVTSRLADERLWAEVLKLGGYDVLAKPFDCTEVHRTISLAWQHWENRRHMAIGHAINY